MRTVWCKALVKWLKFMASFIQYYDERKFPFCMDTSLHALVSFQGLIWVFIVKPGFHVSHYRLLFVSWDIKVKISVIKLFPQQIILSLIHFVIKIFSNQPFAWCDAYHVIAFLSKLMTFLVTTVNWKFLHE